MALKDGQAFQIRISGGDVNRDGRFDLEVEFEGDPPGFLGPINLTTGPHNIPVDEALAAGEKILGVLPGPAAATGETILRGIRFVNKLMPIPVK